MNTTIAPGADANGDRLIDAAVDANARLAVELETPNVMLPSVILETRRIIDTCVNSQTVRPDMKEGLRSRCAALQQLALPPAIESLRGTVKACIDTLAQA